MPATSSSSRRSPTTWSRTLGCPSATATMGRRWGGASARRSALGQSALAARLDAAGGGGNDDPARGVRHAVQCGNVSLTGKSRVPCFAGRRPQPCLCLPGQLRGRIQGGRRGYGSDICSAVNSVSSRGNLHRIDVHVSMSPCCSIARSHIDKAPETGSNTTSHSRSRPSSQARCP